MKDTICGIFGIIGAFIAHLFGGWTAAMTTLIIFMGLDYMTGLIVAGVFKKSSKSETGALESKAGWIGLIRKLVSLLFVLVAYRLDLIIGTTYIKDAVCIAFIVNELISLTENAGLMGIPIPEPIMNAIELLLRKNKNDKP